MSLKNTKVLAIVAIILLFFIIGFLTIKLFPSQKQTQTNTDNITSSDPKVLIPLLDKRYKDFRLSLTNRDYDEFNKVVNNQLRENTANNLKLNKQINNFTVSFVEYAPEVSVRAPEINNIEAYNVNTINKDQVTLYYTVKDSIFTDGFVVFTLEDKDWKYVSEKWGLNKGFTKTTLSEDSKKINFNPTSGFNPKTIEIRKGNKIGFTNITGTIRTYGVNPINFNSSFLIDEDFQLQELPTGKYTYVLPYKGANPYNYWPDSTKIYTGEIIVNP